MHLFFMLITLMLVVVVVEVVNGDHEEGVGSSRGDGVHGGDGSFGGDCGGGDIRLRLYLTFPTCS